MSEALSINEDVPDTQITNQAKDSQLVTSATNQKKREPRKCGECGAVGHDRRTCPKLGKNQSKNQKRSEIRQQKDPREQPGPTIDPPDEMERCYYVVFDIETTGFSIQRKEIIQIAAKIIDNDGADVEGGLFSSLVKPKGSISHIISSLTGITNEDVKDQDSIEIVLKDFIEFIDDSLAFESEYDKEDMTTDESLQYVQRKTIILVAHNCN